MNEIIKSLYNRKSMRVYEEKSIPQEMKKVILEAAAQAPTAGCQQLYTILDITDEELKKALSETCDSHLLRKHLWYWYSVLTARSGMMHIWKLAVSQENQV